MVIGPRLELSGPPVKALETVPSRDEVALAGGEPIPVDQATIERVQQELKGRGFYSGFYNGAIDGIIGPQTHEAISAFQKGHGLGAAGASLRPH